MDYVADFRFYGSLNDFLQQGSKDRVVHYSFGGCPSVKDAIEAIGIPHPEVDIIIANGEYVDFDYLLLDHDQLAVHPLSDPGRLITQSLTPTLKYPIRFIADVHAGKLARMLRMLGIDTVYHNALTDSKITELASIEDRVILTRDLGLLKYKAVRWGYWLRSQQPEEQLTEVIKRFGLTACFFPFTRCIHCNGTIVPVTKQSVLSQLPEKTIEHFEAFYQCSSCKKVYWKGSHYEKMATRITDLRRSCGAV